MLRHKPKSNYNGLTVVLQNPSRADTVHLLSAKGGQLFSKYLGTTTNVLQCDLRVREDKSELLPNTKCILLLGEKAAYDWIPQTREAPSFGAIRGYPYEFRGIPVICSYFPQDAADVKDHESELNTAYNTPEDAQAGTAKESQEDEKSRKGTTAWGNYKFWLRKDIERCLYILSHGIPSRTQPNYIIYPRAEDVVQILRKAKDDFLYIDIESDCTQFPLCFSFSLRQKAREIYTVPVLDFNYQPAYHNIGTILGALTIAFRNNTTVAHNGAKYDFLWLGKRLGIPVGRRCYDTMLAQHRCFPEVEKSLGHCMSIWTWEPYHKDEGNFSYLSRDSAYQLYAYNAKDVWGMYLIHMAIEEYAKKRPGLQQSIDQANASIRPYLITTLTGIPYEQSRLDEIVKENDRLMYQYAERWLPILVGKDNLAAIRGTGKSCMLNSNKQCIKYFHEMLGYSVVNRTMTGAPSLGKESIFKLKLKYPENIVLDIAIAYREMVRESGSLGFKPWIEDENKETTQIQTTQT